MSYMGNETVHKTMAIHLAGYMKHTLCEFNITMENGPFPIQVIYLFKIVIFQFAM